MTTELATATIAITQRKLWKVPMNVAKAVTVVRPANPIRLRAS